MLEFYPLGGYPISDAEYFISRGRARKKLSLKSDEIVLVQSGKQNHRKKLIEALRAFQAVKNEKLRLFIAGSIDKEIEIEARLLISQDTRIDFVGWQSPSDLTDLLCAADVYLQPGTQSATMQHSLCCRCAIILDDVPAHSVYFKKNGWLIKEQRDLERIFDELPFSDFEEMKERSFAIAKEMLDYRVLARRVLI
ncbi:Glycosyl transferases group 1 [compost metagenome]